MRAQPKDRAQHITQSKEDEAVAATNDSTQGLPAPDAALAKSGTPVAEEVVLEDYVLLDFVEDFVMPGELHASAPDFD